MRLQWFGAPGPRLRALSRSPWRVESLRLLRHNVGGRSPAGLSQADQDATAVNFRTGSGDRLTSRRCHEITSAVLSQIRSWIGDAQTHRKSPASPITICSSSERMPFITVRSRLRLQTAGGRKLRVQRQTLEISYFARSRISLERSIWPKIRQMRPSKPYLLLS